MSLSSAGAIHLVLTPAHFPEQTLYGVFFLATAAFQLAVAQLLVLAPGSGVYRAGLVRERDAHRRLDRDSGGGSAPGPERRAGHVVRGFGQGLRAHRPVPAPAASTAAEDGEGGEPRPRGTKARLGVGAADGRRVRAPLPVRLRQPHLSPRLPRSPRAERRPVAGPVARAALGGGAAHLAPVPERVLVEPGLRPPRGRPARGRDQSPRGPVPARTVVRPAAKGSPGDRPSAHRRSELLRGSSGRVPRRERHPPPPQGDPLAAPRDDRRALGPRGGARPSWRSVLAQSNLRSGRVTTTIS